MDITNVSHLSYFSINHYNFKYENKQDYTNMPRPFYILAYISKGQATFTDENAHRITLLPGEFLFIPASSKYISSWKGSPDISYVVIHFLFDIDANPFKDKHFSIQKISTTQTKNLKESIMNILEINKDEQGGYIEKFRMLSEFFKALAIICPCLTSDKKLRPDKYMDRAIEYMNFHYNKKIAVKELADMCHMGETSFYTNFKKYTGMTPIEYKNNSLITRAILLLEEGRLSVEEISDCLGFESSVYFRRLFKKVMCMSPREYRKYSETL